MRDNQLLRVKKCLESALGYPIGEITEDSCFQDEYEMESLHMVLFQVALEDEFAFTFDPLKDNFIEIFSTVGSVMAYLGEHGYE